MKTNSLFVALVEAQEFIRTVEEWREENEGVIENGASNAPVHGSKLSGAVRRASMELTRALAEMRKA